MQIKLDQDQRDTLLKAQRIIHDILPQLDALEKCGKDCTALRDQAKREHANITALLAHFGQ